MGQGQSREAYCKNSCKNRRVRKSEKERSGKKINATATATANKRPEGSLQGRAGAGGGATKKQSPHSVASPSSAASIEIPNNRVECTSRVKKKTDHPVGGAIRIEKMQKFEGSDERWWRSRPEWK